MSNPKDNSGPAFPRTWTEADPGGDGMSLRDYFAAAAITAIVNGGLGLGAGLTPDEMAQGAYNIAAAMLKVRES